MAKNNYDIRLLDAVENVLKNPDVIKSSGTIKFMRPDKRTTGAIYLNRGKIEGLEINNYPNYILNRVLSSGMVSAENYERLATKFKTTPNSPLVADMVQQFMMLPDKIIVGYVKEHFLGVWDEMLTWQSVKVEWRAGVANRELTMPLVSPDKLIDLGVRRMEHLEQLAREYGIEPEQLDDLQYKELTQIDSDDTDVMNILSIGSGEYTVRDIHARFGIIPFNAKRELHQLWLDRVIDLIYDGEFKIKQRNGGSEETEAEPSTSEEFEAETIGNDTAMPEENTPDINTPFENNEPVISTPEPTTQDAKVERASDSDDSNEVYTTEAAADEDGVVSAPVTTTAPVAVTVPATVPGTVADDYTVGATEADETVESPEEPAAQPQPVAQPLPETVPAVAEPLAVPEEIRSFFDRVQTMKIETQAAWEEVVARNDVIQATKMDIAQHEQYILETRKYLNAIEAERDAWNKDFESKRKSYEETITYLKSIQNL
jgi:hypothetical protein